MVALRTILCPVDFSDGTSRQVGLAASLARIYGARLVLHHNLAALGAGVGVGWMWSADHPSLTPEAANARLQTLADSAAEGGVSVALSLTEGPASTAVVAVSKAVDADLVVLTTHQATSDDHTSVTSEVLDRMRRSVLALHDAPKESHSLQFDVATGEPQVTLVPTDLTPESSAAVAFAFELARSLPLELHLVHFARQGEAVDTKIEQQLHALIPDDFVASSRVHIAVRHGDPATGIAKAAADLGAACIVMGEHTRMPLRRWFTHDTSRAVLQDAPCPVWYIPGRIAA